MNWISVKSTPDYSARKMGLPTMPLEQRIMSNVALNEASGCWEWKGSKRNGYGRLTVGSRTNGTRRVRSAHRVSYELFIGEIPAGMEVCHRCDNPCCVNPEHLFAGTRQDNVDDRERKGRNKPPHGERNGKAKLTFESVEQIRQKRSEGATLRKLANEYGVHHSTVLDAINGRSWKFPEPPKEEEK